MQLPPAGYLDRLEAAGTLRFLTVDIVGYGAIPTWDEPGPTTFESDGVRQSGTSTMVGLGQNFLKFTQNRHSLGAGSGLCFGDSGSAPRSSSAARRSPARSSGSS